MLSYAIKFAGSRTTQLLCYGMERTNKSLGRLMLAPVQARQAQEAHVPPGLVVLRGRSAIRRDLRSVHLLRMSLPRL